MRYILLKKAFVDYECRDFHLTPVLTLSWPNTKELTNVKGGLVIAIEWGFWAAYIGCAALLVNPHPAEPGIR